MITINLKEFRKNLDSIVNMKNSSNENIYIFSEADTLYVESNYASTYFKIKTKINKKEKDIAVVMNKQQFLSFVNKLKKINRELQLEVFNDALISKVIKPLKKENKQGLLFEVESEFSDDISHYRRRKKALHEDVTTNVVDFDVFLDFCKIGLNMKENDKTQKFQDLIGLFISSEKRKAMFVTADNIVVEACYFNLNENIFNEDKTFTVNKEDINFFLNFTSKTTDLELFFTIKGENLILHSETYEILLPMTTEKYPNIVPLLERVVNSKNKINCKPDSILTIKTEIKKEVELALKYKEVKDIPIQTKIINRKKHQYTPTLKSFAVANYLIIWDENDQTFKFVAKREVATFEKSFKNIYAFDYRCANYILTRLGECNVSINDEMMLLELENIKCFILPAKINFN